MRRGYIITKYTDSGQSYTVSRLLDEARKASLGLTAVGVYDSIVDGAGRVMASGRPVEPCDVAVNRYKWGHVSRAIASLAHRQYNSEHAFTRYVDKYSQLLDISSPAMRLPRFVVGTAADPERAFQRVREAVGGPPFVMKTLNRSMGQEVFLIGTPVEFRRIARSFAPEKEWLFEEFISSSRGRDLRLMAIRGEAVACMQRRSATDFRSNVALGASVAGVPVTDELRRIAADVYRCTGIDVAGIDLLFGRDSLVFCEVNVMPGLEGIESASGVNVAGAVVSMINSDLR